MFKENLSRLTVSPSQEIFYITVMASAISNEEFDNSGEEMMEKASGDFMSCFLCENNTEDSSVSCRRVTRTTLSIS